MCLHPSQWPAIKLANRYLHHFLQTVARDIVMVIILDVKFFDYVMANEKKMVKKYYVFHVCNPNFNYAAITDSLLKLNAVGLSFSFTFFEP